MIEQDFHETYGLNVDLARPLKDPVLRQYDWRWFLVRLRGLPGDSRLQYAMRPPKPRQPAAS